MNKIAIIHAPDISPHNCPYVVPPLRVGTLNSILLHSGFNPALYDLDLEVFSKFTTPEYLELRKYLCSNQKDIFNYLQDKRISSNLTQIIEKFKSRLSVFKNRNIDVVLITFSTIYRYSAIISGLIIAKILKEKYCCKILIGGLSQKITQLLCQFNFIDFGVVGLAESILPILVGKASNNKNNKIISEPLNSENYIACPNFSCLNLNEYGFLDPSNKQRLLVLPYGFIRGCNCNCIFCIEPHRCSFKIKKISEVIDDLENLINTYSINDFLFLNPHINVSENFINDLYNAIKKSCIKIRFSDSVNIGKLKDSFSLKLLKEIGASQLIFGMETINVNAQSYINKKFSKEKMHEILKTCKSLGIFVGLEVICGFPFETKEALVDLIEFLEKEAELIDNVYLNKFKFLLDSSLDLFPENYNIIPLYKQDDLWDIFFNSGPELENIPYKEMNGTNWEKIKERRENYYLTIRNALPDRLFKLKNINEIFYEEGR